MYSPLRASGGFSALTADVTKTRPPQTTGDDQPTPGTSAFQTTSLSGRQAWGRAFASATPARSPPRKAGQSPSPAVTAAPVTISTNAVRQRMGNLPPGPVEPRCAEPRLNDTSVVA